MAFVINQDTQHFPLPGTATLYVLDRITILGKQLPLDGPIEGGVELDVEKRKSPGSDYATYVSHGLDTSPIRIRLRLFRDLYSGKDWLADYDEIKDRLIAKSLDKRNAINVFHPWLNVEDINSIIFTKRSLLTRSSGLFFTVTLEGFNPKGLRVGSGSSKVKAIQDLRLTDNADPLDAQGKSKAVGVNQQNTTKPTARQNKNNVKTPAQNNKGKALSPEQRRALGVG